MTLRAAIVGGGHRLPRPASTFARAASSSAISCASRIAGCAWSGSKGRRCCGSRIRRHIALEEYIHYHSPIQFLSNLECPCRLNASRRMDIVLVVGREDPFLGNNRHLSQILLDKGVRLALHEWDDRAHHGYYWRQMAPLYV